MKWLVLSLLSGSLAFTGLPASAQSDYPTRTVKIVVPQGAGGAPDVLARMVAQELSNRFNQPFIVENLTGAGGNIGTAHVAKAAPDGYTLLLTSEAPIITNPIINSKLNYDAAADLLPITQLVRNSYFVVACPKLPIGKLTEIADYARKNHMTYASSGFGTTMNLSGELLRNALKFDMTHVPYKSAPAAMSDIVACNVDIGFAAFNSGYPLIASGKLKALAVSTETRRSETPDVPTLRELGLREMEDVEASYHLLAPAKVPESIVNRIHAAVLEIVQADAMKQEIHKRGMVLKTHASPKEFSTWLAETRERYKKIIADAKIPIQ